MFDQNKKFKFNPDLSSVLSNHISRYSLVRATAKRALLCDISLIPKQIN